DSNDVRRQLSRWVGAGRLVQLRRGLYALAPPYAKSIPHPFVLANRLQPGSYVSLQSALAHHGVIPEYVPLTTSVTVGRPEVRHTPLGSFAYRHVARKMFNGWARFALPDGQSAAIARPEKALLDLAHLEPEADDPHWLRGLRLRMDALDVPALV